jgi:uncharacterized repeat protein (TIGR01451 family)
MWLAQWQGPGWLRAATLAALACTPAAALAQTPVTSTFTKQAVAVRPGGAAPVAGQVMVGQRIDYVLTAMAQGPGGVPPSGILDVLSPNQRYVPGSLQMPPGWTVTPNPPYALPANQALYSAPAAASLLSFQLAIPGGGAQPAGPAGIGDGMYPVPGAANGNIYAFYHHENGGGRVDCWSELTLARCTHLPFPLPNSDNGAGSGVGTLFNFNGALVQQRYIYYAAFRDAGGTVNAGLACWDTAVDQPCAFQAVGAPLANADYRWASSQVAGALVIPGTSKVLIAVRNALYCFDKSSGPTSTAICPYWSASGVMTAPGPHVASNDAYFMDLVFELGPNPTRVYVSVGGNANRVQCVRLGTSSALASTCPGLWSATFPKTAVDLGAPAPGIPTNGHDLHAFPDASGNQAAVCLYTADGRVLYLPGTNPAAPACWSPFGLPATVGAVPGFPLCTSASCLAFTTMALGPAAGPSRMVFARWNNAPLCADMATGTPMPCPGWGTGLPTSKRDYGFAPDPLAPDRCVLVLGHQDEIYRFDGKTGRMGCPVTYRTTGNPMDFFCHKKPTQLGWSQIVIRQRPGNLAGGTIVVKNAATGAVLQTVAVSGSNAYSIAGIAYAPNPKLTIEFTPTYLGTPPPGTYYLEVQFTANEAPQICYQARVEHCGEIYNTAQFGPLQGTPPAVQPSAWTLSAGVWLGQAKSDPCNPCRDSLDLAIEKRALYPPWTVGSLGEYQIHATVTQGTLTPTNPAAVTFVDHLPAGLTFHSFTGAPDWSCVLSAPSQVACTYKGPPVQAGQALPKVTIAVNVVGPQNGGTVLNCAVLVPDADLQNNRSCVEATIKPCQTTYDLAIQKGALGGFWKVGQTRTFEIRVNVVQGTFDPATAPTPTVVDVLPAGVTFVSASGTGWTCSAAGQQVSCTYQPSVAGPLPLTALPSLFINVKLVSAIPVENCASVGPDMDPANNQSCVAQDIGH